MSDHVDALFVARELAEAQKQLASLRERVASTAPLLAAANARETELRDLRAAVQERVSAAHAALLTHAGDAVHSATFNAALEDHIALGGPLHAAQIEHAKLDRQQQQDLDAVTRHEVSIIPQLERLADIHGAPAAPAPPAPTPEAVVAAVRKRQAVHDKAAA